MGKRRLHTDFPLLLFLMGLSPGPVGLLGAHGGPGGGKHVIWRWGVLGGKNSSAISQIVVPSVSIGTLRRAVSMKLVTPEPIIWSIKARA